MNSIQVKSSTATSYTIGLARQGLPYGQYVNQKRPFMGLLKKEQEIIVKAAAKDMKRNLKS